MKKLIYVIEAIVSVAMLGSMLWEFGSWAHKRYDESWLKVRKKGYDEGYEAAKIMYKND